jgi:hypothetical protein
VNEDWRGTRQHVVGVDLVDGEVVAVGGAGGSAEGQDPDPCVAGGGEGVAGLEFACRASDFVAGLVACGSCCVKESDRSW